MTTKATTPAPGSHAPACAACESTEPCLCSESEAQAARAKKSGEPMCATCKNRRWITDGDEEILLDCPACAAPPATPEPCPACESTTGCDCNDFDKMGAVIERHPIPSGRPGFYPAAPACDGGDGSCRAPGRARSDGAHLCDAHADGRRAAGAATVAVVYEQDAATGEHRFVTKRGPASPPPAEAAPMRPARTAREVAHSATPSCLANSTNGQDVDHSQQCDRSTAAIEAWGAEWAAIAEAARRGR